MKTGVDGQNQQGRDIDVARSFGWRFASELLSTWHETPA
jgi:hypothetical protein